jgi:cytoskeletal protein CcmA (bactofilin family)
MKKRTEKDKHTDSITTFIGAETRFQGELAFEGTVRLDGSVVGTIQGPKGVLIVGEQARIKADVSVRVAIVMGEVTGSIDAMEKIEMYPPARVAGDVKAPAVIIESGAVLNGRCEMPAPEPPAGKSGEGSGAKKAVASASPGAGR